MQSRILRECKKKTLVTCAIPGNTRQSQPNAFVKQIVAKDRNKMKIKSNYIDWSSLLCVQHWNWIRFRFLFSILFSISYVRMRTAMFIQWLVPSGENKEVNVWSSNCIHSVVLVCFHRRVTSEKTNNNRKPILLITRFIHTHYTRIHKSNISHNQCCMRSMLEQLTWNIFTRCLKGIHSPHRCSIYHSTWQRRCKYVEHCMHLKQIQKCTQNNGKCFRKWA